MPIWAYAVLALVAMGIVWGLLLLLAGRKGRAAIRRDHQLRDCAEKVCSALKHRDAGRLESRVTEQMAANLRARIAVSDGRAKGPLVVRVQVVDGGGEQDAHCLARIDLLVSRDPTGARGFVPQYEHWRFLRAADQRWVLDDIFYGDLPPAAPPAGK
jgi:hypothetical protein